MGDKATLAKAKKELEELYLGVPDDSVNLTFQDLAEVRQHHAEKKKPLDPISESRSGQKIKGNSPSPLAKIPSLDFKKALEASSIQQNHHHHRHDDVPMMNHTSHGVRDHGLYAHGGTPEHHHHNAHAGGGGGFRHGGESSVFYDDVSHVSGYSVSSMNPYDHERGRRRRPGIPHSNICTVCSTYIYFFRHRCLVCGRVYCRECVNIGMGEMAEGRKCIDCLGRRFSQRYIQRAGSVGCCMGYPSRVKQQELKWAEKGPRRSGENQYGDGGRRGRVSISRSPVAPRTPTRAHSPTNSHSFVMGSPYSPTTHHALPF